MVGIIQGVREEKKDNFEITDMIALVQAYMNADPDLKVAGYWIDLDSIAFPASEVAMLEKDYDSKGKTFFVYYYRDGGKIVSTITFQDDTQEIFYKTPFETGRPYITPPYDYEGVLMVIFSIPLIVIGKVIGVGGIDLDIGGLKNLGAKTKVDGQGNSVLVHDSGLFVADSAGKRDPGADIAGVGDLALALEKVHSGETYFRKNFVRFTDVYSVGYPVSIADTGYKWMLDFSLPENYVDEKVNKTLNIVIMIAIVVLIVGVIVAVFFSVFVW